jgi:type IV pilus assembly protein PilX
MKIKLNFPKKSEQRGISLLTTLVLLVIIALIGFSAMQLSKGQFTLSGNRQFRGIAFNEAEGAVGVAETWLTTANNSKSAAFTKYTPGTGVYPIGYLKANNIDPLTMSWDNSNSQVGSNSKQRYLIEMLAQNTPVAGNTPNGISVGGLQTSNICNTVNIYRSIVRGQDQRGASQFIQTIYSIPSC